MRILTISQSKSDSGVPVWNRDFARCFPSAEWWTWDDFPGAGEHSGADEKDRVTIFWQWMLKTGIYRWDCPVIADGFWGAPVDTDWLISVAHGIWDHDRGDFQDKFQLQYNFWAAHITKKRKIVAVSPFIQSRLSTRFGWSVPVINNSIDISQWHPATEKFPREKPIIIHGIKERGDDRKGSDILPGVVAALNPQFEFIQLNEACRKYSLDRKTMLAQADLVFTPTKFEGNSYFTLEALACNIPVVSFSTGLFWDVPEDTVGVICRDYTVGAFISAIREAWEKRSIYSPRDWVRRYSLGYFDAEWRKLLREHVSWVRGQSPNQDLIGKYMGRNIS